MQEILTKFLDTVEQTPALLQLDGALRYVFPLLALVILIRCGKSLLMFRREPEVWAWLAGPTGDRIPVMHWESLIGRGKGCDVTLEYPTISRTHAVLTRYDDGSWTIMDAGSTGGVLVNGKPAQLAVVQFGDVLSFGGVDFTLVPITQEQERIQAEARTRRAVVRPWLTLLVLTLFQLLACAQLCVHLPENGGQILPGFLALIAMQWGLFALLRLARRRSFDVETVAFFLTTMAVCRLNLRAGGNPEGTDCRRMRYFRISGGQLESARSGAGKENPLSGGGRRHFAAGGKSGAGRGKIRREKLDAAWWHFVPAVGAGQNLLCVRGRVHPAASDGKGEPDSVHRLLGGNLRLSGADERLRHGNYLLYNVFDHRVSALGQFRDHCAGVRGNGLCGRIGAAF